MIGTIIIVLVAWMILSTVVLVAASRVSSNFSQDGIKPIEVESDWDDRYLD
jgi:hypothetical protein